ncbi:hypothetical protein [Paenibacillus methanolicus]|uniref:Uncharacterized protein n=1 Tax=Paenibacillus methanolicus TaxID=582686 RepID=A0A5S5CDT4_9BACL|nr:hypothetical protein [Paenibacillus methanolicus]TYP76510.1 hypothetical protein BCM02_103172 [Paenibacillus methanolicus]
MMDRPEQDLTYYSLIRVLVRIYGVFYMFIGIGDLLSFLISLGSMRDGILGEFMGDQGSIFWLLSKDELDGIFDSFIGLALFAYAGKLANWIAPDRSLTIRFQASELQPMVLVVARFYLMTWVAYFLGLMLSSVLIIAIRYVTSEIEFVEVLVLLQPVYWLVGLYILDRNLGRIVKFASRNSRSDAA